MESGSLYGLLFETELLNLRVALHGKQGSPCFLASDLPIL